ncbi:DUF6263 family protein [Microscilla marina]|uniref:Uncharacterized protein n=1 Tax=Microscilla marina ATCC 23134 TaxID=313606 RepID=A1ZMW0_MICM2|nr:DUF6263 family protein [Microscilla marina]EAY28141.1 hypothetical protein M23134_03402 [Microscilla marina ATCC 23134]
MKKHFKFFIFLLFIVQVPSLTYAQKKHKLTLKLTPNTSYVIQQQISQYIEQEFQGQRQNSSITYQYNIKEIDEEGFYKIVVVYKKIHYKQGKSTYNSEDTTATETALSRALGAMIDSRITMQVNNQGQVRELIGADELIEKMLNAKAVANKATRERLHKTFKKAFGEAALRESMDQFFNIYPNKKIAVGDSWSKKFEKTASFPSKVNMTWTLDKVEENTGLINIKATVRPTPNTIVDLGIVTAKYDLNGTQEGSMDIDIETGWTQRYYIKQVMSGTMYMTMNNGSQEIAVDTKITTTSKYITLKN